MNKRIISAAAVIFSACAVMAGAAEMPSYVNHSGAQGRARVLIIGDSITYSNCSSKSSGLCGWRAAAAKHCGQPDGAYVFDTLSQIGISAYKVNSAFPDTYGPNDSSFIKNENYDAAFIMLGINDIGNGQGSLPRLEKSYTALLSKVSALNVGRIYMISVLPNCRYRNDLRPAAAKKVVEFNAFLKTLVSDKVRFLNVYGEMEDSSDRGCLSSAYAGPDYLHPKNDLRTQSVLSGFIMNELKKDSDNPLTCR